MTSERIAEDGKSTACGRSNTKFSNTIPTGRFIVICNYTNGGIKYVEDVIVKIEVRVRV